MRVVLAEKHYTLLVPADAMSANPNDRAESSSVKRPAAAVSGGSAAELPAKRVKGASESIVLKRPAGSPKQG